MFGLQTLVAMNEQEAARRIARDKEERRVAASAANLKAQEHDERKRLEREAMNESAPAMPGEVYVISERYPTNQVHSVWSNRDDAHIRLRELRENRENKFVRYELEVKCLNPYEPVATV